MDLHLPFCECPERARPAQRKKVERACGKYRYRSRSLAEGARHRVERKLNEQLRVYGCPTCGGFHLTSWVTKHQEDRS